MGIRNLWVYLDLHVRCLEKVTKQSSPKWWWKMVMNPVGSQCIKNRQQKQIQAFETITFTLRIRLYVLRIRDFPYIPMTWWWDWNPKNPIWSGGVWILRVHEPWKFTSFLWCLWWGHYGTFILNPWDSTRSNHQLFELRQQKPELWHSIKLVISQKMFPKKIMPKLLG